MDRSKWEYKPFEDCIEKSKKTKQLMTSDYQPDGAYPIISQEASLISGYTDAPDYVNHFDRPVVIFGDHTRVLKYVDFDFAVGADGVKILIPHTNLDAKFLLSFLTWYKIPNLGYSRHYKLLKEISVPVPPIADQQRIVVELDCLNEMIAVKQEQLKEFDKLAQSIFYDMFGDPNNNEKGFPLQTIDDVIKFEGGSQPARSFFEYEPTDDNIRLIQIRDYKTDAYITYIPKKMARRFCEEDDIMIGRYGPPIFQILRGLKGAYNVALMKAVPKKGNKEFIRAFLKQDCLLHHLENFSRRVAGQDGIQMDELKAYPFPYPPLSLQQQFADKISAIEAQKELVKQSIAETQHLLDYTMDKYFG